MINLTKKEQLVRVVCEVFEASIKLSRISEELLSNSPYKISNTALSILISIKHTDTSLTMPQIAQRLSISRQAVQRQIQLHLEAGLIERSENPRHKRSPYYLLTDQGQNVLNTILEDVFDPWLNRLAKKYDDIDLSNAITVLTEISNF